MQKWLLIEDYYEKKDRKEITQKQGLYMRTPEEHLKKKPTQSEIPEKFKQKPLNKQIPPPLAPKIGIHRSASAYRK